MASATGHTRAIRATRVIGTNVYNRAGEHIGEIEDVMLDKTTNNIMFAVVGFGGILGIGEKYHPLPWSMLDYDDAHGGYVVDVTREQLERAPADSLLELTRNDGAGARDATYKYYKVTPDYL